jgi:hypothetical protein
VEGANDGVMHEDPPEGPRSAPDEEEDPTFDESPDRPVVEPQALGIPSHRTFVVPATRPPPGARCGARASAERSTAGWARWRNSSAVTGQQFARCRQPASDPCGAFDQGGRTAVRRASEWSGRRVSRSLMTRGEIQTEALP